MRRPLSARAVAPRTSAEPWGWLLLALVFTLLALARPIDHDESQYVAASVLTARGLLPYRDFAYLQTPLQPFAFAPIVVAANGWAWPALRLVNALLGVVAVAGVAGAARAAGVERRWALAVAGLFACTDILLFSAGIARNDALPVALLALALCAIVLQEERGATRGRAILIGLLLAAAAAAKISYALPAAAYGILALTGRRRLPLFVALGALPPLLLVGWMAWTSFGNFLFEAVIFPRAAPAQYYAESWWKLSLAAKFVDSLKFLALGPALLAAVVVALRRRIGLLEVLAIAGAVAALLPEPTWRQYWLPVLPPLFVALARAWHHAPPTRSWRRAAAAFAAIGLAPTLVALASGPGMLVAMQDGAAIRTALDQAHVDASVSTLSPEFLPATYRLPDPRFATGPFYFRSHELLDAGAEARTHLVSADRLAQGLAIRPQAILVGGEGRWTSGDDKLDAALEQWAVSAGYTQHAVAGGRFRLYVTPR